MKSLLFITHQLPFPPISGGTIKSWKLVDFLSRRYELGLAALLKDGEERNEKEFRSKVSLKDYYAKRVHRSRGALNLLKSYLAGKPLTVYRNHDGEVAQKIRAMAGDYDMIFVDHFEMFQYVPEGYSGKVVFHEHNAEYVLWKRFAETTASFIKRAVLSLESRRIRKAEVRCCRRADLVLAAPNDMEMLVKAGVSRKKFRETYHLGEDRMLDLPALRFDCTEKAILYIGSLWWEANIDGLAWFLEAAWPLVKQADGDVKLYVIGGQPDARLRAAARNDGAVIFTGFVDDLEPYYSRCRVFVAPLRFGSGMKVKVLNAMYRGLPVVTTAVGAEGIAVSHGEHIMIAGDAPTFAGHVHTLLNDAGRWEALRDASRKLAGERYRWDGHLEEVAGYVEEVGSGSPPVGEASGQRQ